MFTFLLATSGTARLNAERMRIERTQQHSNNEQDDCCNASTYRQTIWSCTILLDMGDRLLPHETRFELCSIWSTVGA
jgi:hypothetical protein